MSDNIPLRQQIGAINVEIRERKVKPGMSRSQAEYHISRLEAAAATLEWLQANEARIKGVMGNG
ncbi:MULTISPECIES: hypothetical protein [unclassified Bradyrhizobium]|uniref:hypothetical protein n=1 Tax=unclassified Bradyrhizobium TaxID=2631580 RepID=UPI0029160757|nr:MULTISPECIES: hypothetical protein [unclassified Bradyrhizobium]